MAETVEIALEPGTASAFAPFGELIGAQDGAPVFYGAGLRSWRLGCEIEGRTELMFIRYDHKPMAFSALERHFTITQCFIPLAGEGMVMAVAPRTPEDWSALPDPRSVRAFLIQPQHGVLLWKGVWHSLNRFPVSQAGLGVALITAAETQAELESQLYKGTQPRLTQAADFLEARGLDFKVTDPGGLLVTS
jgi:ureidoglycolate hydrolase